MGNSVYTRQVRCLGCMPTNEQSSFDCHELNIGLYHNIPKGKITQQSTALLSEDEINFFKACSGRNVSLLRVYMNKGVNINTVDEERTSLLQINLSIYKSHVAARHGSKQVIEELIQNNANLNLTDMAGWTPLHVAAFYQRSQVCLMLISAGGDKNIRSRDGLLAQDLVRDKMTLDVFQNVPYLESLNLKQSPNDPTSLNFDGQIGQVEEYRNQDISATLGDKVTKQKENARAQFDEYFRNLKHRLSKSVKKQQLGSWIIPLMHIRKAADLHPSETPKDKGNFLIHQIEKLITTMSVFSHLGKNVNNNILIIIIEMPQELVSDYNRLSPSISQNSLVMQDQEVLHLMTLITLKQKVYPSFQASCFDVFQSPSDYIHKIGATIFSANPFLGLSFMILTDQVKTNPEDIAKLLVHSNFLESKVALGEYKMLIQLLRLFSNPHFIDGPRILDYFLSLFPQETQDYIKAIREFFTFVACDNDPFKLDCLISGVSRNLYRNFRKRPFHSEAALHMFTFAVLVLDIEVNHIRGPNLLSKLEPCIQDFLNNIQGVNDGDNFDQKFINQIIDEVRRTNIARIECKKDECINKLRALLNSFVNCIRLVKKKKNNQMVEYEMYQIENIIFLITERKIKLIARANTKQYIEGKKEFVLKDSSNCIVVATSKHLKYFEVKRVQQIRYTLGNPSDYQRFQRFL